MGQKIKGYKYVVAKETGIKFPGDAIGAIKETELYRIIETEKELPEFGMIEGVKKITVIETSETAQGGITSIFISEQGDIPEDLNYSTAGELEAIQKKRAKEYPSVGDQLDAIWKILNKTPDAQSDAIKSQIQAVKEKYPKP